MNKHKNKSSLIERLKKENSNLRKENSNLQSKVDKLLELDNTHLKLEKQWEKDIEEKEKDIQEYERILKALVSSGLVEPNILELNKDKPEIGFTVPAVETHSADLSRTDFINPSKKIPLETYYKSTCDCMYCKIYDIYKSLESLLESFIPNYFSSKDKKYKDLFSYTSLLEIQSIFINFNVNFFIKPYMINFSYDSEIYNFLNLMVDFYEMINKANKETELVFKQTFDNPNLDELKTIYRKKLTEEIMNTQNMLRIFNSSKYFVKFISKQQNEILEAYRKRNKELKEEIKKIKSHNGGLKKLTL